MTNHTEKSKGNINQSQRDMFTQTNNNHDPNTVGILRTIFLGVLSLQLLMMAAMYLAYKLGVNISQVNNSAYMDQSLDLSETYQPGIAPQLRLGVEKYVHVKDSDALGVADDAQQQKPFLYLDEAKFPPEGKSNGYILEQCLSANSEISDKDTACYLFLLDDLDSTTGSTLPGIIDDAGQWTPLSLQDDTILPVDTKDNDQALNLWIPPNNEAYPQRAVEPFFLPNNSFFLMEPEARMETTSYTEENESIQVDEPRTTTAVSFAGIVMAFIAGMKRKKH